MAGRYNITCDQNGDLQTTLTWKDTRGRVVNLAGASARMQVRPSAASPSVLLELSTVNGRIVLGGYAGTITLKVAAADMASLPAGSAVYDLEVTLADGSVFKLLQGNFIVNAAVTR